MNRTAPIASTLLLFCAFSASAFDGPCSSSVGAGGGVSFDVEVRWPDTGSRPAAGWPVIFLAHGAGGSKASLSGLGGQFADDGYVTLAYSNRPGATSWPPNVFASDLVVLKAWILNDFESESAGKSIAALIVTGDTSAISIEDLRAAGHPYLNKPVRPAKLRALMTELLRHRD